MKNTVYTVAPTKIEPPTSIQNQCCTAVLSKVSGNCCFLPHVTVLTAAGKIVTRNLVLAAGKVSIMKNHTDNANQFHWDQEVNHNEIKRTLITTYQTANHFSTFEPIVCR